MRMNRRNVLVGLGTIVAGGGAALGTGAFSSVEAERSVSINTSGDGSALLQFTVDDSYNGIDGGGDGDTIDIQTSALNKEATTKFDGVLTVTNTGSNTVDLDIPSIDDGLTFYDTDGNDLSADGNSVELTATTGSADLDLEIDTGTLSDGETPSVTFRAQTN